MSVRSLFRENLKAAKKDLGDYTNKEDLKILWEGGIFSKVFGLLIISPIILITLVIDLGLLLGLHRITASVVVSTAVMLARAVGILAGLTGIALCFIGAFQYSGSEPPVVPLRLFVGGLVACAAISSLSFLPKLPLVKRYFGNE